MSLAFTQEDFLVTVIVTQASETPYPVSGVDPGFEQETQLSDEENHQLSKIESGKHGDPSSGWGSGVFLSSKICIFPHSRDLFFSFLTFHCTSINLRYFMLLIQCADLHIFKTIFLFDL